MRKHLLELVEHENWNQRKVVLAPDLQRLAVEIFPARLAVISMLAFGPAACKFLFEAACHLLQGIRGPTGKIDAQVNGQIVLLPKQRKQTGLQQ
jgi:hypothetical protein